MAEAPRDIRENGDLHADVLMPAGLEVRMTTYDVKKHEFIHLSFPRPVMLKQSFPAGSTVKIRPPTAWLLSSILVQGFCVQSTWHSGFLACQADECVLKRIEALSFCCQGENKSYGKPMPRIAISRLGQKSRQQLLQQILHPPKSPEIPSVLDF